ncbi:MAG: hypothetical protein IKQ14_00610 [Candidatus Methanomethylophilaceae archaeon]|nr:hypothetical protein [Candidatus Methanomethylophilaceae archaeon]
MDNKTIAIIAVVAVALIAVAGCAVMFSNGGGDDKEYVYYYANGGTSSEGDMIKSTSTVVLGNNLFTRDGYVCTGYNDKKDGSGTSYGSNANVMLGTKLYAQWESADQPKLIVQSANTFTKILHFNLEPSGTNIDKAWEYNLNSDNKIRVSPAGGTATVGVKDNTITMDIGDNYLYIITLFTKDISISISGSDAIITLNDTSKDVTFSYMLAQVVPN